MSSPPAPPPAPLPHEGALPDPDGVGDSGSLRSGPGVRIAIRVRPRDGRDVIAAARFLAVGLDAARPVASALCAALVGRSVAEAARLSSADVARLAGLGQPTQASRVVYFAKSGALAPFLGRHAVGGPGITCVCFGIPTAEIRDVIARHRLRTVEDVKRHLPASAGCGTCRPEVQQLLDEASSESEP